MMDNLRGQDDIGNDEAFDYGAIEAPPTIESNERRMHVRAYNYWVSLLGNRVLPSIEDLNPEDMEDFSANSVLLDFSMGLENPAIIYLGSALREECGIIGAVERVNEVPSRSLLTRLTDHYLQIIANAAPVGFEAEFINQRDAEIMYRGILMPFSSDDETIDFIYGVISWKEMASKSMTDILGEEMKAAMNAPSASAPAPIWADGPSATADFEDEENEDSAFPDNISMLEADDFGFTDIAAKSSTDSKGGFDFDVESMLELELNDSIGNEAEPETPPEEALASPDISAEYQRAIESEESSLLDELDLSAFVAAESDKSMVDALSEFEALNPVEARADIPADKTDDDDALEMPEIADAEQGQQDIDGSAETNRDSLAAAASLHLKDHEVSEYGDDSLDIDAEVFDLIEETDDTDDNDGTVGFAPAPLSALSVVGADESMPDITDVLDLTETVGGLAGALDIARQSAAEVRDADARSRAALYRAIGHAHDFALTTRDAPADYQALLEQTGITVQERSPMTAIIKLVFGLDYDKTRIAEYALALDYALIQGLPRGSLAGKLGFYEGGLKGLVRDMRATRHGEETPRPAQRLERAYRKIGKAGRLDAGSLSFDDHGVALIVARREADGSVSFVASVDTHDKAAQKLLIAASKTI